MCCEERVPRCLLKQATGQWHKTSDHNVKVFIVRGVMSIPSGQLQEGRDQRQTERRTGVNCKSGGMKTGITFMILGGPKIGKTPKSVVRPTILQRSGDLIILGGPDSSPAN